jgi:chromate reductase, NAD(P)H dehydrogenase (quinone)
MKKVVVLSCTNRPDSYTLKVSKIYESILHTIGMDVQLLDFKILPQNIAFEETFGKRTEAFAVLIQTFISSNDYFVFVMPEYNGSFPGILKLFIDSTHPRDWNGKYACLVGVSDGRAGNLRGLEHLTGILQYLKMHVYHNKLPISVIGKIMNAEGNFNEPDQMKTCVAQMEGFLAI